MNLVSFLCGVVFALGLGISGMTQPGKVTGFLDFFGNWDPSLLFVMIGAVSVYALGFRFVICKSKPVYCQEFSVPLSKQVDKKLVIGALLFGLGWGLSGFCPGPSLVSLVTLNTHVLIFGSAMIGGMILFSLFFKKSTPTVE